MRFLRDFYFINNSNTELFINKASKNIIKMISCSISLIFPGFFVESKCLACLHHVYFDVRCFEFIFLYENKSLTFS
jgi:hypothetical protein